MKFAPPILGFLLTVSFCNGTPADLEKALRETKELNSVSGSAVGYGGGEGSFYGLAKVILANAQKADIEKLLTSETPLDRCMGLYCLVKLEGKAAIPTLKKNLTDSTMVSYFPGGCMGYSISVGNFALNLLLNGDDLESFAPAQPLISKNEGIELYFKVLSEDSTVPIHAQARQAIVAQIEGKQLQMNMASLRHLLPHTSDLVIIKAIGRLPNNETIKAFLLACAFSSQLDNTSKMAAASALTRYRASDIGVAFTTHKKELDAFTLNFEATVKSDWLFCVAHKQNMEPLNAETTWMGVEKIKPQVISAYSTVHPVGLDDFERAFAWAIVLDHPDVRQTLADTLISLSIKSRQFSANWNTYSDLPARLLMLSRNIQDDRKLLELEKSQIQSNIQKPE